MQSYGQFPLAGILVAALALSACDISSPSQVQTGKMRVSEQMVVETMDARHVDRNRTKVVADQFRRSGKSGMVVTVSYLSQKDARGEDAKKRAAAYKKAFLREGVTDVSVVTVPVTDARYADQAIVTFGAMTAAAAKGCTRLPGYQGAGNIEDSSRYQYGCETQAVLGRMVSSPSDLLGRSGTQDGDSRRTGSIIETHQAGTPKEPMQGFSASQIGKGG